MVAWENNVLNGKQPQQITHIGISTPLQKLGQNTGDNDGIVRIQDRHMG